MKTVWWRHSLTVCGASLYQGRTGWQHHYTYIYFWTSKNITVYQACKITTENLAKCKQAHRSSFLISYPPMFHRKCQLHCTIPTIYYFHKGAGSRLLFMSSQKVSCSSRHWARMAEDSFTSWVTDHCVHIINLSYC